MKKLILLIGPPASGKSEFIKKENLKEYSLSIETIKLMLGTPQMDSRGFSITNKNYTAANEFMELALNERMKNGAFTVIELDNTNIVNVEKYNQLAKKYSYETAIITLDEDIETLTNRNDKAGIKRIPNEKLRSEKEEFSKLNLSSYNVIKKEELKEFISHKTFNLDNYNEIVHIGDIHGSRTVLDKILPIDESNFYVFLGDYFNRGIENAEVFKLLMEIVDYPNVILLRGNHELHIDRHLHGEEFKTKDFSKTMKEFHTAGITDKDMKTFTSKLKDSFVYEKNNITMYCTHGGLSYVPENLTLIDSNQLIRGVGEYATAVDRIFYANANVYQVHGHRNVYNLPIEAGKQSFNLNDTIEYGGYLRILKFDGMNFTFMKFKNNVYENNNKVKQAEKYNLAIKDQLTEVVKLRDFTEIKYDKSSRNSVYVNNKSFSVVLRGYEKFKNIEEFEDISFPVTVYSSETGYIAMLGINELTGTLVFSSEDGLHSDKTYEFMKMFKNKFSKDKLENIKHDLISKNECMIFCVTGKKDKKIVLLDIISRSYDFNKENHNKIAAMAKMYKVRFKRKICKLNSLEELNEFSKNKTHIKEKKLMNKDDIFIIEDVNYKNISIFK